MLSACILFRPISPFRRSSVLSIRGTKNLENLDMEIIVLSPNQEQDGFYVISRKQLLSLTYIAQVEGKLQSFYKLVQQVDFGLNLEPCACVYELQICLAKTNNGSTNIQALGLQQSRQSKQACRGISYGIDAVPISYRPVEVYDAYAPRKAKVLQQSRHSKHEYDGTDYAIDVVPISYRSVEAYDAYGPRKAKKRVRCQIEESPETIPVPKKMRMRLGDCQWLNNWQMQPRRRHTGKLDKFYYHKLTKIRCRSLIEVENYELYGIIPPHQEFRIQQQHAILPLNSSSAYEDFDQTTPIAYRARRKEVVEQFLKESYDNLLNLDVDPAYMVAIDDEPSANEEEATEVEEGSLEGENRSDGEEPYQYDSNEETESEDYGSS